MVIPDVAQQGNEQGGEYGDLFHLSPTSSYEDINWNNPTTEDMLLIQQSPELQLRYLTGVLDTAGSIQLNDASGAQQTSGANVYNWGSTDPVKDQYLDPKYTGMTPEEYVQTYTQKEIKKWFEEGHTAEEFSNLESTELLDLFFNKDSAFHGATFGTGYDDASYVAVSGYLQDLQKGLSAMGDESVSTERLTGELEKLKKTVGGQRRKQESMFESLQRTSQDYVAQEKSSRYAGLSGQKTADPTSAYLSSMSKFSGDVEKGSASIYDILYGTGSDSITGVYDEWGATIEEEIGKVV